MSVTKTIEKREINDLRAMIARSLMVDHEMVLPFIERTAFLSAIFNFRNRPGAKLLSAGVVTSDINSASNMAGLRIKEQMGMSPFSGDLESVLLSIQSTSDIVYIANPNRVTGANFSMEQLEKIANAVPDGLMIVDEYYFDFFGITAIPLIQKNDNVIVLRSFTAAFSVGSEDAGCMIANRSLVSSVMEAYQGKAISRIIQKTIQTILTNSEAIRLRLKEVHEESLMPCFIEQRKTQCFSGCDSIFLLRNIRLICIVL